MKIGLIGLGNMGVHFATRMLAAGIDLVAFDTNAQALGAIQQKGATAATSATDVANQAEVILLSLPTPAIVESVATGDVSEGSAVKCVVDLSTTGPTISRKVADVLSRRGIAFIGAPVSGGTVAAEKGTLAIMAAGDEEYYAKLRFVFEAIGKNLFFLGTDPGHGQTMKIINNTLSAVGSVASMEALVFGAKAGLDSKAMLDVLNVSSGRSFATLEKIPQCILDRSFPMRFTTELMHKDMKLCLDEAEKLGATMVVGPAARAFFAFAISQGDGPKDYAHIIKHFENWAGAQFGSENQN